MVCQRTKREAHKWVNLVLWGGQFCPQPALAA